MIGSQDLKLILKGGIILTFVLLISLIIVQFAWPVIVWDDEDVPGLPANQKLNNNDTVFSIYNEKYAKCLQSHSKSSYYPITQRKNVSVSCEPPGQCIHDFLIYTSRILKNLNVTLILIEPSLLFCLLPSSRRFNLLTRGYIADEYKGLKNVVTFGIESSEAKILDKAETRKTLVSFQYKILRLAGETREDFTVESVPHYFLIQSDMILHITVLYPKKSFLFSPAFNSSEMNVKGLQFVNDRAYEQFTTSISYLDTSHNAPVLLPSDSRYFLFDLMSSHYLQCKGEALDIMSDKDTKNLKALKELKSVLSSQMIIFWLWSTSLQGWYEKCDVNHYSEDLKFSIEAKSVEGFNFTALFADSPCQYIENYSSTTKNISSIKLNCYDANIEIVFMYEDKITFWCEHIEDKNTYRLRFPKFKLCSTEISGQKVNVPCESDQIFLSEYGQFLKNVTLKLLPENMNSVV